MKSPTANETKDSETLSDNVFKSFKDDLDYNDENDVGESNLLTFLCVINFLRDKRSRKKMSLVDIGAINVKSNMISSNIILTFF